MMYDAMLRMMKYVDDTSDRGLVLNPMQKWNGNKEHEFSISGLSDSNYVKDLQTQKSISGYRVLLEGAPVMFKSSTQKSVAQGRADSGSIMCSSHDVCLECSRIYGTQGKAPHDPRDRQQGRC